MWYRDALCQDDARQAEAQGLSPYTLLNQGAAAVPPGSDKLIFLPWLSGERAPVLDHYARGGFLGLSMGHTKGHFTRAVMEGVAYHIRWICESLQRLGFEFDAINAIGGGCKSELWPQIISDITHHPLHIVEYPLEAGAMAAAFTVAVGMGIYRSMDEIDDLISINRVVEPHLTFQQRYQDLYHEYREMYDLAGANIPPVVRCRMKIIIDRQKIALRQRLANIASLGGLLLLLASVVLPLINVAWTTYSTLLMVVGLAKAMIGIYFASRPSKRASSLPTVSPRSRHNSLK